MKTLDFLSKIGDMSLKNSPTANKDKTSMDKKQYNKSSSILPLQI